MSYPPVRHEGPGEISARFRSSEAAPDLRMPTGVRAHYLATGAGTSGDFGLFRWEMPPGPSGPSPHFHRTFSESFYVLSGAVGLYDGSAWVDARPGDFLFVPPGGVHAFRNGSGEPASMLILFSPGAPRESYFEELAAISSAGGELDDPDLTAFLSRHDQYTA